MSISNPASEQKDRMAYLRRKEKLLADKDICAENRDLFRRFFDFEEYKLQRMNGLGGLDAGTIKTLDGYIKRFRNVNKWFGNKPLVSITAEDIRDVYDRLEDGRILTKDGQRFRTRKEYYTKVFRSKLFEMAGKADLARDIISFYVREEREVRFVNEEDFRRIVGAAYKQLYQLLLWLAFDVGENIVSLLNLRRSHFRRGQNPDTGEPEYRVHLSKEILKRSRRARVEITNYLETALLLDEVLKDLGPDDKVFPFDYRNAKKFLDRAVERAGVACEPNGARVTWKDLRSGMACDLLKKGWSIDEVNARLGHVPSSQAIDHYVNYLALDRHKTKRKVREYEIEKLEDEVRAARRREQRYQERLEEVERSLEVLRGNLGKISRIVENVSDVSLLETAISMKQESRNVPGASSVPIASKE